MNFKDELKKFIKTPQQVMTERNAESIEKGKNYAQSHYVQLKDEFINKAKNAEYTIENGKRIIDVEFEVWIESVRYTHITTRNGPVTVYKEGIKCVFDDEILYNSYKQELNLLCSKEGIKVKLWGVVDVKPLPDFRWTNKYTGKRYYEVPGKAPGSEIQDFDYMKSYASLVLKASIELEENTSKSINENKCLETKVDTFDKSESKQFVELERQVEWFGGKLENVLNNEYYIKYTEFLNKTALNEYQKRVLQIQYRFLITDAIRGLYKGKIVNYLINNHPEIVTAIDLINEDKVFHKFIWTFKKEDEILVEKCMALLGYEYKKHQIDYEDENVLVYVINVVVDLEWETDLNKANKVEFDKAREYGYELFNELKRRMIEHGMCWYTYGNPEKNLSCAGKLFPVRVLFLNINDDSWAKEGYREDLDHAFRSTWEANVARILNHKQIKWVYEPRFVNLESPDYVKKAHPNLKAGVNYLPDFELEDGTIIEVKGFWDSRSKINVSQFMKQCPDTKYIVIDSDIYRNLVKQYKDIIPNWEDEPVEATNDRIQVVGITFPQRKKFVDVIQPGDVLELVREPENEYDTRAIRVNDRTGNQLGYVAKDCNCIYAPKMDMGFKYEVTVMSKEARVLQCKIKLINVNDIILPSLFE